MNGKDLEKLLTTEFLSDTLNCSTNRAQSILSGKARLSPRQAALVAGLYGGVTDADVARMRHGELLDVVEELRLRAEPAAESRQVLGFVFDTACRFWLVRKKSPEWQRGRLNGIGGKVGQDETSLAAMRRFGRDDIGVEAAWDEYAVLVRERWNCKVYCAMLRDGQPKALNEDLAGIFEFADLDYLPGNLQAVEGVRLLVMAAINRLKNYDAPYMTLSMWDDPVERSVFAS